MLTLCNYTIFFLHYLRPWSCRLGLKKKLLRHQRSRLPSCDYHWRCIPKYSNLFYYKHFVNCLYLHSDSYTVCDEVNNSSGSSNCLSNTLWKSYSSRVCGHSLKFTFKNPEVKVFKTESYIFHPGPTKTTLTSLLP